MIKFNAIFPVYMADNLTALKTFYASAFGFEVVFFDPDFYLHLLHPGNGSQIGFLLPAHASQPEFLQATPRSDGQVISFDVDRAEEALTAAKKADLDVVFPLTEEAWGQVHFMVRDPSGLVIDIVETTS